MLLLACFCRVDAADMRDLFREMPDSILPLLTRVNRLDMLDFLDEGMKSVVMNRLDGRSELVSADRNSLSMHYTENSDIDFHLYYYRDSIPLICMVRTVNSGLSDSRVYFFDSAWRMVETDALLTVPVIDDFIVRNMERDSIARFKDVSQVRSIQAECHSVQNAIQFRYTGLGFLGQDSARFSHFISDAPLVYEWNGRRFVKSSR